MLSEKARAPYVSPKGVVVYETGSSRFERCPDRFVVEGAVVSADFIPSDAAHLEHVAEVAEAIAEAMVEPRGVRCGALPKSMIFRMLTILPGKEG